MRAFFTRWRLAISVARDVLDFHKRVLPRVIEDAPAEYEMVPNPSTNISAASTSTSHNFVLRRKNA